MSFTASSKKLKRNSSNTLVTELKNEQSPRTFGPLILAVDSTGTRNDGKRSKSNKELGNFDEDPMIADMLSYPYPAKRGKGESSNDDEEGSSSSSSSSSDDFIEGTLVQQKKKKNEEKNKDRINNSMLRIDETAELLLTSLKRNRQLQLQLSEKQKKLLKDIGKFLVYEEEDGVRKSKARMAFKELKEGEDD